MDNSIVDIAGYTVDSTNSIYYTGNWYPLCSNQLNVSKDYIDKVYVDNIKMNLVPPIKEVLFYDPATIVYFEDGTKTVVKKMDGEVYNPEFGFLLCIMKRAYGEDYHKLMWEHCWGGQEARRADKRKQVAQKKKKS